MADASPDDSAHLEQLIATLRRRVRLREIQLAGYGPIDVPPYIVTDKEAAERDLRQAIADLRRLRPGPADAANPYLGLLTFQEADAARFFGRDALVADLVARAWKTAFLAVLGASGSGKSSVVRAGLLPLLKGGALPGSDRWRYVVLRPGARPLDALAAELARLQGDATRVVDYAKALAGDDRALLLLTDALLDRAAGQRLVLMVDQCEELWTLAPAEERRQFVDLLITASSAADTPLLAVLAMRADFLHRAAEHPGLAKAIAEHDVIVSPMQADELRAAIERPAEAAGGSFEPGLVDELVAQALDRAGALPLLEYTLQELWKQRDGGVMTWAAYRALGGIEGALAARADTILAERYTPEQQDDLRRLLLRLVQPGEGEADTRRRVRLDDLVPASSSLDAVQALLKPLTDERLLTTSRDAGSGAETVEISHEALIRAWPAFGRWIADARADLRFQLQFEEATREWQASGENSDLLWGGLRLAQVEVWIERTQPRPNARDQAFIDASRAEVARRVAAEEIVRQRDRQQTKQLRRRAIFLVGALVVVMLAVIVAVIFAINAQHSAKEATDQQDLARTAQAEAQSKAALAGQQSHISNAQARAGEALFELTRPNVDEALLLARAAILTDTQSLPLIVIRAIRQATQQSIPVRVLRGHADGIYSVAWSPDGKQIVTGSFDKTAWVWDVATSQPVRTLEGHTGSVFAAAWSPDGKQIVTGSFDKTARVWDVATGQSVRTLKGHTDSVLAMAWSPDGKQIVTGSYDKTARVWDVVTGRTVRTLEGHTSAVFAVAWSPDGKQVLTGGFDETARVWDVATGKAIHALKGHTGGVNAVAWSPDGRRLLTGSGDNTARVWEVATDQSIRTLQGHTDGIYGVAWSPDGMQIVTGSFDKTARVWDLVTGRTVRTLEGHASAIVAVAWSPDGKQIVTSSLDKTARVWDMAASHPVRMLDGHNVAIFDVAWSPDGKQFVTGSDDNTARVWDMATGRTVRTLEGHTGSINAVAWSPDGKQIVTSSYDKTARMWDMATGRTVRTLQGHDSAVSEVAWSPDGAQIVTGSYDKTARVWDVATGRTVRTLQGHDSAVFAVVWSPDGKQLITASDDDNVQVWDVATGKLIQRLEGHTSGVNAVAWSPDGKQVLIASRDNTVWVWDVVIGRIVRTLEGHTSAVFAVAWSPDGKQFLTGSRDGSAGIWIADDKPLIAELTRRVCNIFTDDDIKATIPTWRGCGVELAAVADDLKAYDALRPRQ